MNPPDHRLSSASPPNNAGRKPWSSLLKADALLLLLLAALTAGAAAGSLIAAWEPAASFLEKLGGPLLGRNLASSDNLALAGGLLGLAISAAALSRWRRRRTKKSRP